MQRNKPLSFLKVLAKDESGVAAIEFVFVGSFFLVLLLGAFDLGHTMFVKTVIEGSLQDAARSSTLQTGSVVDQQNSLDKAVRKQIRNLNTKATVVFSRRFYKSFDEANKKNSEKDINSADAAKNGDGKCEKGFETFLDVNNNGVFDKDGGNAGQGGAQDMVIYSVKVSYPRMFPFAKIANLSDIVNITASTVMQNQPYSTQSKYSAATTRDCL